MASGYMPTRERPATERAAGVYAFAVVMPHRPPGRYLWDDRPDSPHRVRLFHFTERDLARRKRVGGELRAMVALARRALRQARDADAIVSVGALAGAVVQANLALSRQHAKPTVILECIIYPQSGLRGAIKTAFFRGVLARVDAVVCGCTAEVDEYHQRYGIPPDRVHVAHLFAARDVFDWPRREPEPRTVFAGGNAMRDWPLFAEAVRGLAVAPHVCADPRELGAVATERHVDWHGSVPRREFLDRMMAAEIVVVPLRPARVSAGHMVLLQAMAMGKPVVVTDSPAAADYVEHEQTALVVPCGDAGAMRSAIERLRGDPALRERLGGQARETALARFSGAAYASRVESILERVAESARKGTT